MKRLVFLFVGFVFIGPNLFAASVQCDFNDDGYADLAIGVPGEDVNGHLDAGAVQVLYGRSSGLSATNNQLWNMDSPDVVGEPSDFASFGNALACGDFNHDGLDDLAIGAYRAGGSNYPADSGSVTILY